MSNTNVLEGVQCPQCKSFGPFDIEGTAVFRGVTDDGCTEFTDMEWTEEHWVTCCTCQKIGHFHEFQE